jgi:hypothetical protein
MSNVKGVRIYFPYEKEVAVPYYANFNTTLLTFATKYDITTAETTAITAHKTSLTTLLATQVAAQNAAQQATQALTEELHNAEIDAKRIMKKIMNHAAFVRSDGEAMGFLVESPAISPDTAKPVISKITSLMGMIVIDWVKAGMDGVVVYCAKRFKAPEGGLVQAAGAADDPTGIDVENALSEPEWEEIGRDMRSPFEDTRLNLANRPEVRLYTLRYLWKDKVVGLRSDIVKVVAEIYNM